VINIWLQAPANALIEANATIRSLIRIGKGKVDFSRVEAYTRPNESLALIEPSTQNYAEIFRFFEDYWNEERALKIETGFPLFDADALIAAPCSIRFFGNHFGHNHQKRYGDIEIAFENVAYFAGLGEGRQLARFDKVRNFRMVLDLVKHLTISVRAEHLIMSTSDTEINPLCAHMVFHKHTEEFIKDLKSIAALHTEGGIYRHEGKGDFSPLKITKEYGHLRCAKGDHYVKEFIDKVDRLADYFAEDNVPIDLSRSVIKEVLSSASGVVANSGDEGTMVFCEYGPSSYLDEVYWNLFSALRSGTAEDK